MNMQQALNIFGLSGQLTEKDIKTAYRKAALKFHPDRNPVGVDMMKAVNSAFDFIMNNLDKINSYQGNEGGDSYNFGDEMENVLNCLRGLSGIIYEVIGNWIWISGDTISNKDELKKIGCKWAPKKKQWFYRPDEYKSSWNRKEHSLDEIRVKYGTTGQQQAKGYQRVTVL